MRYSRGSCHWSTTPPMVVRAACRLLVTGDRPRFHFLNSILALSYGCFEVLPQSSELLSQGTRIVNLSAATEEPLARIIKVPKRELMRRGINQHTLEKICTREPVRAAKLAKCLEALEDYERSKSSEAKCRAGRLVI